jgi:hypothetical protein
MKIRAVFKAALFLGTKGAGWLKKEYWWNHRINQYINVEIFL